MEQKPGDFFIGVVNFFAILLPGAVLAFFCIDLAQEYINANPQIFGNIQKAIEGKEVQQWVIFIVASYLLGQFIFLLGSPIDKFYDMVRTAFTFEYKNRDKSKPFKASWIDRKWVGNERLYDSAQEIKKDYVGDSKEKEIVNAFQWAKANVELRFPAAANEIYRLEADQKFFRGLIVVLIIICALFLIKYKLGWHKLVPYLIALVLSFWRYVDQRRKSTNLAYTYLIALEKLPKEAAPKSEG